MDLGWVALLLEVSSLESFGADGIMGDSTREQLGNGCHGMAIWIPWHSFEL
jgi:hypothetical protein